MSPARAVADPLQPTDTDVAAANEAKRVLARLAKQDRPVQVQAAEAVGSLGEAAVLPHAAVRLLLDILGQIADGNAVSVVPIRAELTTQQAADMLGVSRPFLVGLLAQGALSFHKVGTHRRIRFGDLMAYKRGQRESRHQALDDLARQGQELGLGY